MPHLVHVAAWEQLASVQLLAIAGIRIAAHEVMAKTIKLLAYARTNPECASRMRWAAATTLGLMGPVAMDALPTLRTRLKREQHADVRAAVEWAIAEIGGQP